MNDLHNSLFAGASGAAEAFGLEHLDCGCWTCVSEEVSSREGAARFSMPFIVCDLCGNKRCPRATHHDNACTQSNDPEQPGSRYGGMKNVHPAMSPEEFLKGGAE